MKTFNKTSLPDSISYNNETYTKSDRFFYFLTRHRYTKPKALVEHLNKTKHVKAILVKVLPTRLKGVKDLHGNHYKPSEWIFTNENNDFMRGLQLEARALSSEITDKMGDVGSCIMGYDFLLDGVHFISQPAQGSCTCEKVYKAVQELLINKGIDKDRIKIKYGTMD